MSMVRELTDHFGRTWSMLRGAIEAFPEGQWRSGDVDFLVPARQALHAVEAAEYYMSEYPGEFEWGHRFGADWEGAAPEKLPTRTELLGYLDEVRMKVDKWLAGMGERGLLEPRQDFPWTGKTALGRALYVLRHIQHHLAEMNTELRRRGIDRPKWQ
jgi:hypothetical protein